MAPSLSLRVLPARPWPNESLVGSILLLLSGIFVCKCNTRFFSETYFVFQDPSIWTLSGMEDDNKSLIRFDSVELTDVPLVRWVHCVMSAEKHLNLDF